MLWRREYPNLTEAECSSCTFLGGEKLPWVDIDHCTTEAMIRKIQGEGGVCPRVELRGGSYRFARLAHWGLSMGMSDPFWGRLFDLTFQPEEREAALLLLARVLTDDRVRARMAAEAERAKRVLE